MSEYLKPTIEDIEKWAESISKKFPGKKVKLFLGGDMHWLWQMMGLAKKGKHFCLFCTCDVKEGGVCHNSQNINFPSRTYRRHIINMENFRDSLEVPLVNNRGIQSKAADHMNCINEPLISAPLYGCVIPLPLHLILGMGKLTMDIAERECREKDLRDRIDDPSAQTEQLQTALKNYEKQFIAHDKLSQLVCNTEEQAESSEGATRKALEIKLRKMRVLERQAARLLKKSKNELLAFDGQTLRRYRDLINSILVHRKINQGLRAALVGSVVGKLLTDKIKQKLVDIIRTCDTTAADNMKYLLDSFTIMHKCLMAARRLTDEEIVELRNTANTLGAKFPQMYPTRQISPKLHILFIHVPEFAERYRTIGLFSESAFESIHGEFNRYDKTYACMDDDLKQLVLSFCLSSLKHDVRIAPHVIKARVCKCGKQIKKSAADRCTCCVRTRRNKENITQNTT